MGQLAIGFGPEQLDNGDLVGRIHINDFSEGFHAATAEWRRQDYEDHWRSVFEAIRNGAECGCMITSLLPTSWDDGFAMTWMLYRTGPKIVLQNHIVLYEALGRRFEPEKSCEFVPPYSNSDEDGRVSEWSLQSLGFSAVVL